MGAMVDGDVSMIRANRAIRRLSRPRTSHVEGKERRGRKKRGKKREREREREREKKKKGRQKGGRKGENRCSRRNVSRARMREGGKRKGGGRGEGKETTIRRRKCMPGDKSARFGTINVPSRTMIA
jgi:hypothetical protein